MPAINSRLRTLIVLIFCGCGAIGSTSGPNRRIPNYAFGFANRTQDQLTDVRCQWTFDDTKLTMTCGRLGHDSKKQYRDAPDPIPPSVSVIWKTPDGKEHSQIAEVPKSIRDDATWTGTLWFKFTDQGVDVIPLSKKQMDDLADARKGYP